LLHYLIRRFISSSAFLPVGASEPLEKV
jgi:hypothetical protein